VVACSCVCVDSGDILRLSQHTLTLCRRIQNAGPLVSGTDKAAGPDDAVVTGHVMDIINYEGKLG
jgi:hypothetical protein